jgi:signal transduction histidine kinase/DNA-binding response OmpR family regulator/Tfp pilus assembly protein PilF
MNRLSLALLFFVMSSGAWCQNKKLDSLYSVLNNHPQPDTLRAWLLVSICYYEYTSNNEKNKVLAEEALEISRKIDYKKGIGMALKYHALYYWVNGNYERAIVYAIEMLKVFENTPDKLGLSQAYNLLGLIYHRSNDYDKAKTYYKKALNVRQRAGLIKDVAYSYNSLGALCLNAEKYDEALAYFHKSLQIRKQINDGEALSQSYGNIAGTYMAKKEYSKSLEYFQKTFQLLKDSPNKYRIATNLSILGEVYIHLKNYGLAKTYLTRAEALAKAMRHKEVLVDTYSRLKLLETSRERFESAMAYSELMHTYKDSIYTEKKAKQIAEAEALYESEKKDRKILALEQQKQIQNLEQTFLLTGLCIAVPTFLVIYLLQRSHNKKIKSLLKIQESLNLKLQETDHLKSKFFANISHEFRTPLSLILAPVEEKLSSSTLISHERESFDLIKRNAIRLLDLINQLLDLSKLEVGKMELRVKKGNLKKFLLELVASFDSLAEHQKINFVKILPSQLDMVCYDADALEKIVNNLLSNAFKFTPPGGTVEFSAIRGCDSDELSLKVSDNGRGIAVEDLPYIFLPFYRSKHIREEDPQGTGLGLSLVQELVKLYGGTIKVDSSIKLGTTFSLTLPVGETRFSQASFSTKTSNDRVTPLHQAKLDSENAYLSHEVDQKKQKQDLILFVEDNNDLRNFISINLSDSYLILTAKNGEEGLAVAINSLPSLIISDVMMPQLDGFHFAQELKSDERTCHIPVVLLTAKADLQSRLEGLETGADDYLSKPFSTAELRVRIKNLIEQRKRLACKYRANLNTPRPLNHEPSLDEKFLQKVKEIVEKNIGNTSFGVEQMAGEVNLSRAQLFRKLKAITGLSPNEFINDIRLEKAAALISAKADILTQIGYSVGYNEQSYFAKRFRKKFGVSPKEFAAKSGRNN